MGFFSDLKKSWRDIRSTRTLKDFGVVCETIVRGNATEYRADLVEVSGVRYLRLHRTVFRANGPAIKNMDFNKTEVDALTKDFEHIANKTYDANASDPDILEEISMEMGGSGFTGFITGTARRGRTIKNFNRIARQRTGEKTIETCLVVVEEKDENLIHLVRREREKRSMQYDQFMFREGDAALMADLFKEALQSM